MKCKICGGDTVCVHKGTNDNKDIDVHMCTTCGAKQLNKVLVGRYEDGYNNSYVEMSDEMIRDRLSYRLKDNTRRYNFVKNLVKKESATAKKLLDYGCGFGGFLTKISEDIESYGVEIGRDEFNYIKKIGLHCKKNIDEFNFKFDFITLFQVFEHFDEPIPLLLKFAEYLNDHGKLIIEVPNADDALISIFDNKAFQNFSYWSAHLILYTKKSFELLVKKVGIYDIASFEDVQRFPLSNTFCWLSKGLPDGQDVYKIFNDDKLNEEYKKILAKNNFCDTLLFVLEKK